MIDVGFPALSIPTPSIPTGGGSSASPATAEAAVEGAFDPELAQGVRPRR